MNRRRLVLASLAHYRATHLGVVLGVVLGAAVLTGALVVGDSVRLSLREQALLRIGSSEVALASGERLFETRLAGAVGEELEDALVAPALELRGVASAAGGARRALGVQVLGVDPRFFRLAPEPSIDAGPAPGEVFLNERLAHQLEVGVGERIVLRVDAPAPMPRETELGSAFDGVQALGLEVARVLTDAEFGRFGLTARQLPPYNAFLSLGELQERLEVGGRVNLCLVGGSDRGLLEEAESALQARWRLEDVGLRVRELQHSADRELDSDQILFDPSIDAALARLERDAMGVFTYLVNELRVGERSVPYSLIAGIGPACAGGRGRDAPPWETVLPSGMRDDQIVINTWLAEDLQAGVGDTLELVYAKLDADRALADETRNFEISDVVAIQDLAADRELMPPFPGIAGSESCSDWDPGIPIDLSRIRERDEDWWDEHEGTPKAFVTLGAARSMWATERFGALTAVRIPREESEALLAELRAQLDPSALGLRFRDVRGPALAASSPASDFGGLFLGLSTFLLISAFLLVGLLLALGVLQRSSEVGLLLAIGFAPRLLRRLLLYEAALLSVIGSLLGALAGAGYAQAVMRALRGVWQGAVAGASLDLHVRLPVLLMGAALSFLVALLSAWVTLRKQARRDAVELLVERAGIGLTAAAELVRARRRSGALALVSLLGAVASTIWGSLASGPARPAACFAAGSLALIALLALCRLLLLREGRGDAAHRSLRALASSNAARRPARSLATIVLLACGSFLLIVVGANRKALPDDPAARSAGTGGFALIGRSTLAVVPEPTAATESGGFLLSERQGEGVEVVAMRVRDGDEASCLNLNRPQSPRLLGVRPEELAPSGALAFAKAPGAGDANPWLLLKQDTEPDVIPAIGDQAAVTWSLHRAVGEGIPYVDERGREFQLRIVATLAGSILQGDLLVDEERFQERFPSETGHRMFLVDAPMEQAPVLAR